MSRPLDRHGRPVPTPAESRLFRALVGGMFRALFVRARLLGQLPGWTAR